MSLLASQRTQIRHICMEIDSLKSELRDNPAEFAAEMRAIAEWCKWQARLLAKTAGKAA